MIDIFSDTWGENENVTDSDFLNFSISTTQNSLMDCSVDTRPSIVTNIALAVLYSLVCMAGIFGNSLVIFVVIKFSKMQTVTNYYILNLAIADLCFLVGIPFLIFTMFYGQWIFGNWFCKLYWISQSITQLSTSYFLLIMACDRYIAVCHPIESPRFRNLSVSKIISLLLWAFSFLLMSPVILYADTIQRSPNGTARSCVIKWNLDDDDNSQEYESYAFILYSFVLGFALPLALIMTFYYLVIRKLKTLRSRTKSKERKRSHRKVTKLVLIIIAMYVCFWSPYWTLQIYSISQSPERCKTKFEIVCFMLVGCLVYLNSSLNPLLYAFLSESFKKSFLKACSCTNKNDFHIFHTDSPIPSKFSKTTRSSEKRHYQSVSMKINRGGENRCRKLKAEKTSVVATDESKEIILISTMHVNNNAAGGGRDATKKKKEVLQTDL